VNASGQTPRASVIIPNWNGLALLRPCLDSLARQTCDCFEVLVVDNASTDGSVEAVRSEYPTVRVLALPSNRGYAGGCNAGIEAARGRYLVLLNNDTEAEPAWLERVVDALDEHPEVGMVASRIMLHDRRDMLHSAGDLYGCDGIPNSRGVWQRYGPPYDEMRYVFGACGGAMGCRREMLEDVGVFETAFFMYCEDVDLNWRAQLGGWKCLYLPDAVVYHHLSATGGGALASFYVGRNTLWVIARNYPWPLLRRHCWRVATAQWRIAFDAFRACRGKAARRRLLGQLVGLLTWPRWLPHRRRLARRVDLEYIESILD